MTGDGSSYGDLRWNEAEARLALKTTLASATFARSRRGRELLAYLVEQTLQGRQGEIKAFTIACDVFRRDENFDADNDALVRVQAARVRTLLEEYYAGEGSDERLRISLPKGGYAPVFEIAEAPPAQEHPLADVAPQTPAAHSDDAGTGAALRRGWSVGAVAALILALAAIGFGWWGMEESNRARVPAVTGGPISVLASSFTKFSSDVPDKSLEFIHSQLMQLTQLSFVTIYAERAVRAEGEEVDPIEIARRRGIHYLLEGRVLGPDGALRVNIDLLDVKSGRYIWTQTYNQKTDGAVKTLDEFALSIMSSLHVVLLRAASNNAQGVSLDSATPWDLYFLAAWINSHSRNSLAWEKERVTLARLAIRKDADFGPAYSLLASKLAYLANVDAPSDTAEARAEAKHFARQAIEKAPGDADVAFNLALYDWYAGRIGDASTMLRRTLDIAPHHPLARFLVNAMPYSCAEAPNDVVEQLIAYDARLPRNSPERWVTLTWVALLYLNNGDYPHSVEFSRRAFAIFHTPDTVYRYAAALAHAGAADEARDLLDDQKEYWPGLDPKHYAEVAVRRRCEGAPRADFLYGVYEDLIPIAAGRRASPRAP